MLSHAWAFSRMGPLFRRINWLSHACFLTHGIFFPTKNGVFQIQVMKAAFVVQHCRSTLLKWSCRKHKTLKTYTLTPIQKMRRYPQPVMNLLVGGFFRGVRHVGETAVLTTSSPNPKLNAPNASNLGFPTAFSTREKSSRLSMAKLQSNS